MPFSFVSDFIIHNQLHVCIRVHYEVYFFFGCISPLYAIPEIQIYNCEKNGKCDIAKSTKPMYGLLHHKQLAKVYSLNAAVESVVYLV